MWRAAVADRGSASRLRAVLRGLAGILSRQAAGLVDSGFRHRGGQHSPWRHRQDPESRTAAAVCQGLGAGVRWGHREIKPGFVNLSLAVPAPYPIFRRGYLPRRSLMSIWKQLPKFAAILAIAAGLAGCGVNTIPTKDQAVKARWADVQAAYQRRNDLIPNLANTVAGYAAQEKSVLTAVTQARASATQVKVDASTITDPAKFAQFQQAQDKLSGVLGRLMMISENYPDL